MSSIYANSEQGGFYGSSKKQRVLLKNFGKTTKLNFLF